MTVTSGPPQRYKRVQYWGGIEELDRFGVRDAIRAGEITAESEIAILNTDDWRPAASFPEFRRYLDLAGTAARTAPGVVLPSKPPRQVATMSSRIVNGIVYPIAGGEVFMLLGLALLSILPFISVLAKLAATVIMVDIVRTSAEGRTRMPLVDTTQGWQLMRTYLRVLFVTMVSLIPAYLVGGLALAAVLTGGSARIALLGLAIALALAAVYYPACLATVAVWDSILASLNPMYVARVFRIIGGDYFIVIALWFAATFLTTIASMPAFSPFAAIPFAGGIISAALSYWALFYVSHLLGYAVYRHAPELGWE